jgi:ABC-type bacteriocin/lantibiotic exporter with double-glycine peptidase domain
MKAMLHWCAYLSRGARSLLLCSIALMIALPVLSWFQFQWSIRFFNQLTEDMQGKLPLLLGLLLGLVAIKLMESVLIRWNSYIQESMSHRFLRNIDTYQFELIKPSDITRVETPAYQQDWNLLKNNLSKLGQLLQSAISILKDAGIVIVYAYLIMAQSWLIVVAIVVFSIPNLVYVWKHASRLDQFFARISQAQMEASRVTSFLIMPLALKEMLVFAAKPFFLSKWRTASDKVLGEQQRFTKSEHTWGALVDLFSPLKYAATHALLLYLLYRGDLRIGDYLAISAALVPLDNALRSFIVSTDSFVHLKLFQQKRARFNDRYMTLSSDARADAPLDEIRSVRLDGLTFRYPDREATALREVSLDWESPGSIAIVGANGSGKSTLAKVLAGLHRMEESRLFFNGTALEKLDRSALMQRISIVSQDFVKYPMSLFENIALSVLVEHDPQYEYIKNRYPELIPSPLRNSPETLLGNEQLNAVQLSGGQWQRIAIARGLYKDCDLLILDEATSELDSSTEAALMGKILTDRKARLTVIVTHNLNLAALAGTVVVMDNGQIVEQGPPSRLMSEPSRFRQLREQQIPLEVNPHHGFQSIVS